MKLQTKIPLQKQSHNQIDYHSKLLLLGSCFVENIGQKLDYYKFQNLQNPTGILFHSLAVENLLLRGINKEKYTEKDVFELNEQWQSFGAHSRLNAQSKEELLSRLNIAIDLTNQRLNNATHIIITLGTAWVYRHIETDAIVANCHKVPQKKFLKELLSMDEIYESLESIHALIRSVNTKASIVFTVSPVRHLKDGFIENTQSKAHLISAIHEFLNHNSSSDSRKTYYFPSYEIMMDELRDYRFYAEDMIHPSPTAIDYIWDKFKEVWFHYNVLPTMKLVEEIQRGREHRPFNPDSKEHLDFVKNLEEKHRTIQAKLPHIRF